MLSIVYGPPLSGKSTFASKMNNINHISVGKICRHESSQQSFRGLYLKHAILYNWFIPSQILLPLVLNNNILSQNQENVLDGIPKYSHEINPLKKLCKNNKVNLKTLHYLNPPLDILLNRLKTRRTCNLCYKSSTNTNLCSCGGLMITREEDSMTYFLDRYSRFQNHSAIILEKLSSFMEIKTYVD
ncbi:hypothetical protein HC864_03190 [Candidatus Gracilibacteria bacterium]|nr:hypothetical protein [Candidatus Gracilibacteria bacterium]